MNTATYAAAEAQARAIDRAHHLALILTRAQGYARNIDHVLYLNLAAARARGRYDKFEQARDLARQVADHLATTQVLARALGSDLADAGVRAVCLAHDLDRDLGPVYGLTQGLDSALIDARASRLARDIATRDLRPSIARACKGARSLCLVLERDATDRWEQHVGHVAPSAGRLVAVAARLLPEEDRSRYLEEYQSELWDMAQAGAGCGQQCRYGLHQLIRAADVRIALLDRHRKNVSP